MASNSNTNDGTTTTLDYSHLYKLATEANTSLNIVGTINEMGVIE